MRSVLIYTLLSASFMGLAFAVALLRVGVPWLLYLLAGALVVAAINLYIQAKRKNKLGLAVKLMIIGSIIIIPGVLFLDSTAGSAFLYTGMVVWFCSYLLWWIAPRKAMAPTDRPPHHENHT